MKKELVFTDGRLLQPGTFYGIGNNYALHAKEMGNALAAEPVVFIKPSSAYIQSGEEIIIPPISNLVHHEVELVVVIGNEAINIDRVDANKYIAGYAVGIDVTLRDLQTKNKKEGKPWAVSKGFHTSAPISEILPIESLSGDEHIFTIELFVNGQLRQRGSTADMERPVGLLVEYLSKIFTLNPGDCIFTGTPEGVGQILPGDKLSANLSGLVSLDVSVGK